MKLNLLITVVVFCACSNTKQAKQCNYSRFEDVFYNVLDSLSILHTVNGKTITLVRTEDNVQQLTLTGLVDKYPDAANKELVIAKELISAKNDSLPICFNERRNENFQFLFGNKSLQNFNYEASDYFGSVIASNIHLTENGSYGGFYIAINCGDCSSGYVAFIEESANGIWQIDKINKVWGPLPVQRECDPQG